MQTLHSILIAINDYPNNPLKGCINDVENMRTTLADFCKSKGLNYKEHLLINNAATRPAIIEAYKQFKTASEGDTCLVYYSGHGYRIAANPSQWTDGDSLHEAIYTFDADTGGRGLVNKELAYLMWKNTQHVNNVHIVEIFDCCHAGGITRTIGDNVTARTIPGESKALPQQEYFGFQEYINNGNGRFAAPVARRVQLAASTGKETSKELTINNLRRGAFTTSICEILREDNFNVSYKDLLAKANVKVKNYIKDVKKDFGDQSPQIDAERVESETQVFTGKGMATSQSYIVGFSQESGFWEIKAGLIESISQNTQIRITETGDTFTLSEVNPSISKVLLPQKYDRSKQYHAEIIASFNNKIIVAFAPQVTEIQKNIFNAAFAKSYDEKGLVPRFFEKIEDVQFASFLVHCEGNDFYLTTKKDVHTPLFLRCPSEDLAAFFDASEKVGKWFIVKDLNNPSSALTTNDIKVEIAMYSASGNYERPVIKNWQDGFPTECTYDLIQDTPKQPRIALSITNNARKPLWVSVAFLSSDFSITNKVIPTGKELVEHADHVRLNVNGEEKIWLSIPKGLRQKNVLEVTEYFKIFVSTDELSTDSYNQSELPMDLATMRSSGPTKSIGSEEEVEEPTTIVTPDWRTYDVELRIKMPTTAARVIGGEGGAAIANHTIAAPSGFEADISIGATSDAQRSIGVPSAAVKLEEADFQPYFLSPGMATGASQSTLTFKKVENAAAISVDNSIKISLPNRSENEMVVAMAYDPETGLYYPTGFENTQGELEIHTLPDATNDGQRSLGGSVVMFLQKVSLPITTVLGKAKTDDDFYKLRIAKIPSDLGQETEYEADKAKIAAEISKAKKIILFVHGIIGDTTDQVKSLKRMNTDFDYDVVLAFDYENLDSNIEDIATKLKAQLESIGLKEQHGKELHFVVHSMGGLVSRWFIEQLGGDKVVTQLVMIGTPNNGSEISSVTTYVSLGVVGAVNFACTYFGAPEKLRAALSFGAKHGTKRLLNTLSQMNPDGDFIKKLNEKGQESTVPYHIIAGDIFAINLTFKENGIFKTLMGLVERGAGQLIYKQSNDIAVRVESIKNVKGVGDDCKFEIAVDHMSYFADPKGVTQLEFVLQKINNHQPINIIPPITRNTTTVVPKSNDIPPIIEANTLGFLAKLIQWIKSLF